MTTEEIKLAVPTVHLNGTSRRELLAQIYAAQNAIRHAVRELEEAAPHGRDYCLQTSDAFPKAQREHCARINKLAEIQDELDTIGEAIADQADNTGYGFRIVKP